MDLDALHKKFTASESAIKFVRENEDDLRAMLSAFRQARDEPRVDEAKKAAEDAGEAAHVEEPEVTEAAAEPAEIVRAEELEAVKVTEVEPAAPSSSAVEAAQGE